VSSQWTDLAKELWMWALDNDIILTAQHILGVSNTIYSRHEIADSPQQVRPDALPVSLLCHNRSIQTTGCGSIYIQIETSDTLLLQLETRPAGVSSDCIPTGLRPTERLCQPTLVLNW